MFDYKTIVSDSDLTMEFVTKEDGRIIANDRLNGNVTGEIYLNNGTFTASDDTVFFQYKLWMTRPERKVGHPVQLVDRRIDELIADYEELLVGAYILNRPNEQITPGRTQGYMMMLDWLRSTDFYSSPASTIYHGSYPGGLLIHSLQVYNEAISLMQVDAFKGVSVDSLTIAALTHDWCKIDSYESYMKNVKNEETGQWEKVPAYKKNFRGLPLGHGATSMFLASRFFKLDAETACAIRWHMARFNVCDSEVNEFQTANETYPLVHLIQFADQLSITSYEADRTGVRA